MTNKKMHYQLVGVVVCGLVWSQSPGQSKFPLSQGNAWRYSITYMDPWPPPPPSTYTVRIVGDSLMPNAKRYWVLEPPDVLGGRYIRSDSQYVYYWMPDYYGGTDRETQVFDLRSRFGAVDTISIGGFSYASGVGSYGDTVFGRPTIVRAYSLGGLVFGGINIADGFGYSRYVYNADSPSREDVWTLKGCIISDTLYGSMTEVTALPDIPQRMELFQNSPNPFNPGTIIGFRLPRQAFVQLEIFDIIGRRVSTLVSQRQNVGVYNYSWIPEGLPSGVYFYRLTADRDIQTKKLMLLK